MNDWIVQHPDHLKRTKLKKSYKETQETVSSCLAGKKPVCISPLRDSKITAKFLRDLGHTGG